MKYIINIYMRFVTIILQYLNNRGRCKHDLHMTGS